jgi:hypothetical protein
VNSVARQSLSMQTDRRKNFRCPPGGDAESVVLRNRGIDQTAQIVNLSAEGFRVSFEVPEGSEPPQVDDVAILSTPNGSHQVRVANIQVANGTAQLGLERLADLVRPSGRARKDEPAKGHVGGGRRAGDPSSSMLVKVVLVAAIAVLGIVGINLTLTSRGDSNDNATADKDSESVKSRPESKSRTSRANEPRSAGKTAQEPIEYEKLRADPQLDATVKISAALKRATRENKQVVLEFGTEKCDSCYGLRDFIAKNAEFAAAFQKDFVLVLVDKTANQAIYRRFVPAEHQADAAFFTLLDKDGQIVKGEKTENVAEGTGFVINKIKALLQPPPKQ